MIDLIKLEDDYFVGMKLLHQTKKFKNIEFHKFKLKGKYGEWQTFWYLDEIDINKLINPSKLDKRLYW